MKKEIILFPGQNSLRIEEIKKEYKNEAIIRDVVHRASEAVGIDFVEIIMAEMDEQVHDLCVKSMLLFTISVATYKLYKSREPADEIVLAGHSLGEISALACAGVFKFEDALQFISRRAQIAKKAKGKMYVVTKIKTEDLESVCKRIREDGGNVFLSCINSPMQNCISGDEAGLKKAVSDIKRMNGISREIVGNAPYHCEIMSYGVKELKQMLQQLSLSQPDIAVMSGAYVLPYSDTESVIKNLIDQFVMPIYWENIVKYIRNLNFISYVEMGYSTTLSNLMSYILQ